MTTRRHHPVSSLRSSFPLWLFVLLIALTGCKTTKPQSTRMTAGDLNAMSAAMAQSLAQSDALRDRGPDSPLWVVSIDKVENLSSDLITESERWYVVQKVRSGLPIRAMSQQKNIRFVIPAEQLRKIRREGEPELADAPNFGAERKPTHQMTATFRSIDRATETERTDLYYAEFEMIDLNGGVPVWIDKFEYKRSASGHRWD